MLVRVALVAEVLPDLVHALEAADDQPLEVELARDPEVEILVEQVRARDERLCEAAAVARLQQRRLHLDETVLVEGAADRRHHARAEDRVGARLPVHQQVEVPAPVALLDLRHAVEGVGQRRPDGRQELQLVDDQARLTAPAPGRAADRTDDVAEVQVRVARRARRGREQLDAARAVDEVEEDELAQVSSGHDAAGEAIGVFALYAGVDEVRLSAGYRDLDTVGKSLRQAAHRRPSLLPTSKSATRRAGLGGIPQP